MAKFDRIGFSRKLNRIYATSKRAEVRDDERDPERLNCLNSVGVRRVLAS